MAPDEMKNLGFKDNSNRAETPDDTKDKVTS